MRRLTVTCLAAFLLLLIGMGPAVDSIALAAAKRRTCNCKPGLRKTRRTSRVSAARLAQNGSASVVGPVYATYTLEPNEQFRLRMNQTLNSEIAHVGDRFTTTVVTPVYVSGAEVVPAGSTVEGRVASVRSARTRAREGQLSLSFDSLILPDGKKIPLDGVLTSLQDDRAATVDDENEVSGRSSEKRNVVYIGGGTAGGALLGGIIGGGKGAGIGAAIGAGAGVAGVMLSKGREAEIRSGTEVSMMTTRPITFRVRSDR